MAIPSGSHHPMRQKLQMEISVCNFDGLRSFLLGRLLTLRPSLPFLVNRPIVTIEFFLGFELSGGDRSSFEEPVVLVDPRPRRRRRPPCGW